MKLIHFLMKLQNETVQIELKNGSTIKGSIVSVSPQMNISLKKCKMTLRHRDPVTVDFINIRGNNIRDVILPDSLNLDMLLSDGGQKKKRKIVEDEGTNKRVRRAL
jgi:small nuclear ribonucleoprotein D1